MEPSNAKPKRSGSFGDWFTRTVRSFEQSTNDYVRKNYAEPQAQAAADAATREALATVGEYALPVLTGAGAIGLTTHGLVDWFNSKRKDGEYKLPTGLLTMIATLGGGTLGGYLWNQYGKKASADIPIEVDPSKEVSEEDQEALTDPQGKKKKKKKELPSNITQMIYAQNAKKRYDSMKSASLTYSKVAELMGNTSDPTPGQEWDSFRMANANPGVSFMWDDEKRQYVPHTYDQTQKTNVPYTGKINQPAPLTEDQQWDRQMYIKRKQMPTTTTTSGNTTTTTGNGTFRFGQYQPDTQFTTPKPVQPVQPPQYRQLDTTVKDTEFSFR
jgi:hypothetical protein